MKVVFAGGGSGGHFYPLIAIAEELTSQAEYGHFVMPKLYYLSDKPYNKAALFENNIEFVKVPAGKRRLYFSIKNFFDYFKILYGSVIALIKLFSIYPDVVVSKGGYASFPTVVAAWILRIPIIIHESDAVPGRANLWAARMARYIGITYKEAADYFPKDKTALVGIPIRRELHTPVTIGAREYLKLEPETPVILILGGSQGATRINSVVLQALDELLPKYQILHQVGAHNVEEFKKEVEVVLPGHPNISRYHPFGYLTKDALAMAAGVSSLVVTRAGSTTLAEIALWGLPSIVIPIPKEISRDQERNAYNYVRNGAGLLLEEHNLTEHIFANEVDRLLQRPDLLSEMGTAAKEFAKPEAAQKIAKVILDIIVEHESK